MTFDARQAPGPMAAGWPMVRGALQSLWAAFWGLIAISSLVQQQWLLCATCLAHAAATTPLVSRWAADHGRRGVWLAIAAGSFIGAFVVTSSMAPKAPAASVPQVAAPVTQAQTGVAESESAAGGAPERSRQADSPASGSAAGPSIARQAADDTGKFAKLIMMGRRTMEASLVDPRSAQYRDVWLVEDPKSGGVAFCGSVNAKNSLGGYTGYRQFILVPGAQVWFSDLENFANVWNEICAPSKAVRQAHAF